MLKLSLAPIMYQLHIVFIRIFDRSDLTCFKALPKGKSKNLNEVVMH